MELTVPVKLVLYVLELEDSAWYIGISSNLNYRLGQHEMGNGSKWTQEHKFKRLHEVRYPVHKDDENNATKEYSRKYGWENVRGGSYCHVNMNKPGWLIDEERDVPLPRLVRRIVEEKKTIIFED